MELDARSARPDIRVSTHANDRAQEDTFPMAAKASKPVKKSAPAKKAAPAKKSAPAKKAATKAPAKAAAKKAAPAPKKSGGLVYASALREMIAKRFGRA